MEVLIINSAEPEDQSFVDPIKGALVGTDTTVQVREYGEVYDVNSFDAVIISASPKGDDIVNDHRQNFEWLLTYQNPVLGICAGHQLIGTMFGGELKRDTEAEDGDIHIQIVKEDPLFKRHEGELKVEQHHNDSITLPADFELLATSDKCEVQAMRHKERPTYSVQWHAERSNPDIIRNFINEIVRGISTIEPLT